MLKNYMIMFVEQVIMISYDVIVDGTTAIMIFSYAIIHKFVVTEDYWEFMWPKNPD